MAHEVSPSSEIAPDALTFCGLSLKTAVRLFASRWERARLRFEPEVPGSFRTRTRQGAWFLDYYAKGERTATGCVDIGRSEVEAIRTLEAMRIAIEYTL
jgi:hypothetical protein